MKVGYARISATKQNIIQQEALMQELGVEKVFFDKASSRRDTARHELQIMLQYVKEGDTLIVESYSRLARSTRDLLCILDTLKQKNVEFISIKETVDTTKPSGGLILTLFAGLADFERDMTQERQREGVAEAKKAGKYKGRKPIDIDKEVFESLYKEWKAGKVTAVWIQKSLEVSAPTFYRRVKQYEARHDIVKIRDKGE